MSKVNTGDETMKMYKSLASKLMVPTIVAGMMISGSCKTAAVNVPDNMISKLETKVEDIPKSIELYIEYDKAHFKAIPPKTEDEAYQYEYYEYVGSDGTEYCTQIAYVQNLADGKIFKLVDGIDGICDNEVDVLTIRDNDDNSRTLFCEDDSRYEGKCPEPTDALKNFIAMGFVKYSKTFWRSVRDSCEKSCNTIIKLKPQRTMAKKKSGL